MNWQIVPYAPIHKEGLISAVRKVYDEYGFTWEAEGYHRDLYDVETYYIARGGMFWVLLAEERGSWNAERGTEGKRQNVKTSKRQKGEGEGRESKIENRKSTIESPGDDTASGRRENMGVDSRDVEPAHRGVVPRSAFPLPRSAVVGCVGVMPHGEECELHRMYLAAELRGRGLGRELLETAIEFARGKGCRAMRAWSDVKLTDAHRLYLRSGFVQSGERICDDPDKSREYGFWKEPL